MTTLGQNHTYRHICDHLPRLFPPLLRFFYAPILRVDPYFWDKITPTDIYATIFHASSPHFCVSSTRLFYALTLVLLFVPLPLRFPCFNGSCFHCRSLCFPMASTSRSQSEVEMKNVFNGRAPASPFASSSASITATSSSSPLQKRPHNVLINHREADVKSILAKPIYNALHAMGVRPFLDLKELELNSASLCLAIFSPGYAQSDHRLAQLSFMVKSDKPIFPVFYRVKPSDLRWAGKEKGMYANAFKEHQEKGDYSTDKLKEWEQALHEVSFVNGEIIDESSDLQDKLKRIEISVSDLLEIRKGLAVAKHPVGIEEVVADFEMTVSKPSKAHLSVQIVGIWGMSGSGKTTLSTALFNQNRLGIKRSSIIFNVKERQLDEMQSELVQNLGFSSQQINGQEKGKNILSNFCKCARVFIVLDDVDHINQLDALLSGKDDLEEGSLIIVTTQDKKVLTRWNISCMYEMKKMKPCHAKELFCRHVFSEPSSPLDFEELVQKFVSACDGLPLSLAVLGGQLSNCFDKDLWNDTLQKISKILPKDIEKKLKVSYDALDEQEKHMFLDVACFLIGKDKMTAIAVWEGSGRQGSGWNALCGWASLVDKCLVDLDSNNHIRMHGHLRDLGREIAKTQLPSRLLSSSQITAIQKHAEIRGMMMHAASNEVRNISTFLLNISIGLCGFRRTRGPSPVGLKILLIRGNCENNTHIVKLSRELAWLSWTDSAFRNLPSWLSLKNLRVLELHSSQKLVRLWKDEAEAPVQLRVLIVSYCPKLGKFPKSIVYLYNLKKIFIEGSNYLREIDILPTAVEEIQVGDCKSLRNINGICNLVNLRKLMLSGCPLLDVLPSFSNLASLEVFELTGSNKVEKIQGLQHCTSLEKLMLNCKCWEVPGIESFELLQSLRRLQLVAKKRAAVEPCIQMMQKWPEETKTQEIIICTKAVADVGSHLNSSAFPNLCVHDFANKKISHVASCFLTLPQKQSSNDNAIMLCLVIQCLSPRMEMVIKEDVFDTVFSVEVEEGKWILIGIFTQHSRCLTEQNFYIHQGKTESHQQHAEGGEVEKGFLVTGKEPFLVEALHRLLAFIGK